jgi:hypothetical protein
MSVKNKLSIFAFLLINFSLSIQGNTGSNFLSYGAGARTMGMGRCGVGLSDDASAPYYNPAGLSQVKPQELLFMHSVLFMGTHFEYFSYAMPTSRIGSFAFSLVQARIGDVEDRDDLNNLLDEFGESETASILSYSMNPINFLSLGINYKIIQHSISHWSSLGQDCDIGLMLFPEKPFSLGLTVKNLLQPSFILISEVEQYPLRFGAGASFKTFDDNLILVGDVSWHKNSETQLNGGLEYKLNRLAILRLGADHNYFTYGIGFNIPISKHSIRLDYAFSQHHRSEGMITPNHNFSLTFNFGGFRAKLHPDKEVLSPLTDGEDNILWLNKEIRTRDDIEKWELLVKNRWGEIARTYRGWGEPPQRFYWDGRDDTGKLVRYGDYYYKFEVREKNGRTYTSSGKLVTVKTEGPKERFLIEEKWEGLDKDIYIDKDIYGEKAPEQPAPEIKKENETDEENNKPTNRE